MVQGEFTLAELKETKISFDEIFKSLSKNKQRDFLGHANDIYLFFAAAKRHLENLEGD